MSLRVSAAIEHQHEETRAAFEALGWRRGTEACLRYAKDERRNPKKGRGFLKTCLEAIIIKLTEQGQPSKGEKARCERARSDCDFAEAIFKEFETNGGPAFSDGAILKFGQRGAAKLVHAAEIQLNQPALTMPKTLVTDSPRC